MGTPIITDPALRNRTRGRIVIALFALYALALQSVLGGMPVAGATGPEHVLCLSEGGPPGAAPADKHLPAHGHLACCAAAHVAMPVAVAAPEPAAIRPPRPAATTAHHPAFPAAPRAPPGIGPSPRAPPVA